MGGRRVDDLDDVLGDLRPRLGSPETEPEPLEGGITNRNYRVRLGGRDCVVRLAGKDTSLLAIDRVTEWLANSAAADLGLAPPVLARGEDWIVTGYVPGAPAQAADVRSRPEAIAEALRRFHGCGLELPSALLGS